MLQVEMFIQLLIHLASLHVLLLMRLLHVEDALQLCDK